VAAENIKSSFGTQAWIKGDKGSAAHSLGFNIELLRGSFMVLLARQSSLSPAFIAVDVVSINVKCVQKFRGYEDDSR